jgi:hypothetical protein
LKTEKVSHVDKNIQKKSDSISNFNPLMLNNADESRKSSLFTKEADMELAVKNQSIVVASGEFSEVTIRRSSAVTEHANENLVIEVQKQSEFVEF